MGTIGAGRCRRALAAAAVAVLVGSAAAAAKPAGSGGGGGGGGGSGKPTTTTTSSTTTSTPSTTSTSTTTSSTTTTSTTTTTTPTTTPPPAGADVQAGLRQRNWARVGNLFLVEVSVANVGTATAVRPMVRLDLPSELLFYGGGADEAFFTGNCVDGGLTGRPTCVFEDLPAGRSTSATVAVRPLVTGELRVTATASTTSPDTNRTNDAATEAFPVTEVGTTLPKVDGVLAVETNPTSPMAHTPITYTARLTNPGPRAAPASVWAPIPAGTTLVGFAAPKGRCNLTDAWPPIDPFLPSPAPTGVAVDYVSCGMSLAPGETAVVTLTVTADHAGLVRSHWGSQVGLDEWCQYEGVCWAPLEGNYRNNWALVESKVSTPLAGADLFPTHRVSPRFFYDAPSGRDHRWLRYQTEVANPGPAAMRESAMVTVDLPRGAVLRAIVPSEHVRCEGGTERILCTVPALPPGVAVRITTVIDYQDGAPSSVVTVDSASDPDPTNNRSVRTYVYPPT